MIAYESLPLVGVGDVDDLASPAERDDVTLDSPATTVFTSFGERPPVVAEETTSIDDALALMQRAHVRFMLVVDKREKLLGVLSSQVLAGDQPMMIANRLGVSRAELMVKNLMTPKHDLLAIPLTALQHARVGDLLHTLKSTGEQHLLIIAGNGKQKFVAGIVSAGDIERTFHLHVDIPKQARSFAEIYQAVKASHP
jgi:DeoR family transcriptional regulator, catabolite repression regulator